MASKLRAAALSIGVNLVLLASKIVAAILTGSVALLAESAHSLFDLVSSVLAYFGVKKAAEPSDETHSFGHDKFETLSSFLQSILITVTALIVLHEAYVKIREPSAIENSGVGIVLMVVTIPVTLYVSRYLSKTAKDAGGSQALEADAAHFTTDVLGSIAVLIGLLFVRFGYWLGDGLAAIAVGLIMLFISFTLIRDAYHVFMDYDPHPEPMQKMRAVFAQFPETTFHKLRARRAGSKVFAEVHIQVDSAMSVHDSHALAMRIKRRVIATVPQVRDLTIHVEPHERARTQHAKRRKRANRA